MFWLPGSPGCAQPGDCSAAGCPAPVLPRSCRGCARGGCGYGDGDARRGMMVGGYDRVHDVVMLIAMFVSVMMVLVAGLLFTDEGDGDGV